MSVNRTGAPSRLVLLRATPAPRKMPRAEQVKTTSLQAVCARCGLRNATLANSGNLREKRRQATHNKKGGRRGRIRETHQATREAAPHLAGGLAGGHRTPTARQLRHDVRQPRSAPPTRHQARAQQRKEAADTWVPAHNIKTARDSARTRPHRADVGPFG